MIVLDFKSACCGLHNSHKSLLKDQIPISACACRFMYESAMPVSRLVRELADKAQVCTQRSWKRPYGVGVLSGGYDQTGAKLYYNCPSGNYYEYKANAVGARSQVTPAVLLLSACALFVIFVHH